MKQIYILLFSFLSINLVGQISINPGSLQVNISEDVNEYVYNLSITNSGNSEAKIWWKIFREDAPTAWKCYMCDIQQCYTPAILACPPSKPNTIAAGKTVTFTFHFQPFNTVGTGKLWLQLYNDKEYKNVVAETDKNALVTADKTSSVKYFDSNEIKLFPNPTDDYFVVKNDINVSKISIYNIIGKEMVSYKHTQGNTYDVSFLNRGVYIVRLVDSKGKMLKSTRLSKR